jgi:hypothetical protein
VVVVVVVWYQQWQWRRKERNKEVLSMNSQLCYGYTNRCTLAYLVTVFFFMVQNFFKNRNISKKLKLRLKNAIRQNVNIRIRNLDTNKERQKAKEQF